MTKRRLSIVRLMLGCAKLTGNTFMIWSVSSTVMMRAWPAFSQPLQGQSELRMVVGLMTCSHIVLANRMAGVTCCAIT